MNRAETLALIREHSCLLTEVSPKSYNKVNWEMRSVSGGKIFMLVDYGEHGFEILYPEGRNNLDNTLKNFMEYAKLRQTTMGIVQD